MKPRGQREREPPPALRMEGVSPVVSPVQARGTDCSEHEWARGPSVAADIAVQELRPRAIRNSPGLYARLRLLVEGPAT
jgi:hypothetical protein